MRLEDHLDMGIWPFNREKKIIVPDNTIVDSSEEPINKSRRKFVTKTAPGIAGAAAFIAMGLNPSEAEAAKLNDIVPPLFKEDLCVDRMLASVFAYMMRGGLEDRKIFPKLVSQGGNAHEERIDPRMRFCHPGTYIAMNTFSWKYNRSISWTSATYDTLREDFYHNFALNTGIDLFYRLHVRRNQSSNDCEKWLVENIFACAEENPINGIVKAQEYLSGSFADKTRMIAELSQGYKNMKFDENEKFDLDISGKSGKGPLNNWHRMLSAQTGAFFLTCHYDTYNTQMADLININVEKEIRNKVPKVRGPPYYWS